MNRFFLLGLLFLLFTNHFTRAQSNNEPCGDPGYTMEGKLANSSATSPVILLSGTLNTLAKVGDKGELSKQFEENLFGGTVSGWLVIGVVEVTSINYDGNSITCKVLEKKSEVTLNGKSQSHFVLGKTVKFSQLNYKTPIERKLYYSSGEPKSAGTMVCGKETGNWKYYFENGKIQKEGVYNNEGLENGYWRYNNVVGLPLKEGNYVNGKQNGEWKFYDENGTLKTVKTYQNGRVTGPYKEYYSNGKIKIDGGLLNDEEHGYFKFYDENGLLTEEGNYTSAQKDGVWIDYDHSGVKHGLTTYVKGKKNGLYQYFFGDGKISWEGYYNAAEQREGEEKHYYDNGQQKSSYTIVRNYKSGPFKTWYMNGQLNERGEYTAGEMFQGLYESYFDNGKLMSKGYYDFGNKTGKWEMYDEKGRKKVKKYK